MGLGHPELLRTHVVSLCELEKGLSWGLRALGLASWVCLVFSLHLLSWLVHPANLSRRLLEDLPRRVGVRAKWDYVCQECTESREWKYFVFSDLNESNYAVRPLSLPPPSTLTTLASIGPIPWENTGRPWMVSSLSLEFLVSSLSIVSPPPLQEPSAHSLSFLFSLPQRYAVSEKKLISVAWAFSFF